jgi:flagellar hook protein FlgE
VIDPRIPCPPKATTVVSLSMNIGVTNDGAQDAANPYFSLLLSWNALESPPLDRSLYGYAQPITVYDADGRKQELTLYMDRAPDPASGKVVEYILARNPDDPASAEPGEGLLMAGTLTFSGNGQLVDMSAFTPTAVSMDLADWVPARLANGMPQFTMDGQAVALDLGIMAPDGWRNPPASALDVATNPGALPKMEPLTTRAGATTAYGGASSMSGLSQDGYPEGYLTDVDISDKGVVIGIYSNGRKLDLYQIPVCRFTSEDGLRHEGNNLYFSSPDKTGPMTMGVPNTDNYGAIMARHIEGSNVEMSREMTLMIMLQRGFQMNSKSITTSDTMLQRAIELKRS